jgi:hypothetical protein
MEDWWRGKWVTMLASLARAKSQIEVASDLEAGYGGENRGRR